jgi:hypothetical protein
MATTGEAEVPALKVYMVTEERERQQTCKLVYHQIRIRSKETYRECDSDRVWMAREGLWRMFPLSSVLYDGTDVRVEGEDTILLLL